jgi:hypothetical protein
MIINLRAYVKEVEAVAKAAERFVARESYSNLMSAPENLKIGIDSGANTFKWITKGPIKFINATKYDSKTHACEPVVVSIGFVGSFRLLDKKKHKWNIDGLVTQIKIFKKPEEGQNQEGLPIMHMHIDKKNNDQRGPHIHIQVSEDCTKQLGMKLAVPRIPFNFVLPTDCIDFVLAEFFPDEWHKAQTEAHSFNLIRNNQLVRAEQMLNHVGELWKKNQKRTPVTLIQDYDLGESFEML